MVAESTGTVVTSAHAQVIQTNATNQSATGHQPTIPIVPHVVPQMQPQYQPNLQAIQPIPQQMGMAQNSVITAQHHVQLPLGSVMHASATSGNLDLNDRGLNASGMESSLLSQSQSQAASNTQQSVQQQLSASAQSSQGQGSN